MDRLFAALLAGLIIGLIAYSLGVLLVLMDRVVDLRWLLITIGVGFGLSVAYDVLTTVSAKPPSSGRDEPE